MDSLIIPNSDSGQSTIKNGTNHHGNSGTELSILLVRKILQSGKIHCSKGFGKSSQEMIHHSRRRSLSEVHELTGWFEAINLGWISSRFYLHERQILHVVLTTFLTSQSCTRHRITSLTLSEYPRHIQNTFKRVGFWSDTVHHQWLATYHAICFCCQRWYL